jgi:hypothetical protein
MTANTDYVKSFIGSRLSANVTGSFAFSQTELDFIESEALELYGVATAAEATDTYKIHTLLKFKALERMWIEVSDAIDHRTDGESFSNSQFAETIEKLYKIAKKDAIPYLPASYGITIQPFETGYSPYLRSEG